MTEWIVDRSLADDIRDFTYEKWKKQGACELCGTDRWMIYPDPTTHVYLPVGDEGGPPRAYYAPPMVAFLPVSCINCGNLRLIDARTFEKWRRERTAAER
jgi:hypothetical protein